VDFPVDMTNCAIVATAVNGGGSVSARQSSISEGNRVAIVTFVSSSGAEANESFSVIGIC
jgi:hypothetical protein